MSQLMSHKLTMVFKIVLRYLTSEKRLAKVLCTSSTCFLGKEVIVGDSLSTIGLVPQRTLNKGNCKRTGWSEKLCQVEIEFPYSFFNEEILQKQFH